MKNFIYISEYNAPDSPAKSVLKEIIEEATRFNKKHDITGALFFHNNVFLQVIEGDCNAVDELFEKIRIDKRHKNVQVIYDNSIQQRHFPGWRMKLLYLDDESHFSPEIIAKIKQIYEFNLKFNPNDFIVLLQSLLNDDRFMSEIENMAL